MHHSSFQESIKSSREHLTNQGLNSLTKNRLNSSSFVYESRSVFTMKSWDGHTTIITTTTTNSNNNTATTLTMLLLLLLRLLIMMMTIMTKMMRSGGQGAITLCTTWYKGTTQLLVLTEINRNYFSLIPLTDIINR